MSEDESSPPQEKEVPTEDKDPASAQVEPRDQNVFPDVDALPPVDPVVEKSKDLPAPAPVWKEEIEQISLEAIEPIKTPKPKRPVKPKADPAPRTKRAELPPIESVNLKSGVSYSLPKGVKLPDYFLNPAEDEVTNAIQRMEADDWLCGVGHAVSYSALLTYIGPRPNASPQVYIAKRAINPNRGNWRVWRTGVTFWRDTERLALVKDPDFIRKCLQPKGGHARYFIRFVEDEVFQKEAEKGRILKSNLARIAAFPFRVRQSRLILGLLDTPLQDGEAALVLENIKAQPDLLDRVQEGGRKKLLAFLEVRKKADLAKKEK